MITIDNTKGYVGVEGDKLTLASELSYIHHTLYHEGFNTNEFASVVCTLLFLTFSKEERLDFIKKLDFLVEQQTKRK